MRHRIKAHLLLLYVTLILSGCANLKEVGSFAATSQRVMEKNKMVSYGYYDYYHDAAYIYHPMPANLRDVDCHCDTEKVVDTSLSHECAILSAYFGKLALFTDSKSAIDVNPLGKSVVEGTYGMVTISSQESSIASGLATGLSDVITTGYKSKRIKVFLQNYHDSVAPIIGFLALRAGNFSARIMNLQIEMHHVADSLISNTKQDELKWPILFAYEREMKDLAGIMKLYKERQQDFEGVLKGGDYIYKNANNLHAKDFKKKLKILVANLTLNADIK